jgi:hypothetical protein
VTDRAGSAWWRFSIRELLLLTAAVGAFLAWAGLFYQRSRPYERTAVPDRIANFQDIQAICASLGHKPASYSSGGGGSSIRYGTIRSYDCQIDLPAKLRSDFLVAYRQHVRTLLEKNAQSVRGAGSQSDGSGLRGFDFEYTQGRCRGTVVVRSAAGTDGLTLFVFVHEYDVRP